MCASAACIEGAAEPPRPHATWPRGKRWEPRGFSRVAAAFSSYDGDLSLPLGLALGSPIFPSGCEGKLGVALAWGAARGRGAQAALKGGAGKRKD